MAQTYFTLEEAADKLGISPGEFKKRLRTEWTHIRPLQDGSTQRFKSKDVEELGRQIGIGSEEELQLVDSSSEEVSVVTELNPAVDDTPKSSKALSSKTKLGSKPPAKKADDEEILEVADPEINFGDKEIFLMADDESPSKKSSGKIRPAPVKSDSDVRLEPSGKVKKPTSEQNATTDEIELDILPRGSSTKLSASGKVVPSSSNKLKSPSPGKGGPKSGKISPPPAPEEDSSEFELNLDADSSDEFELSLASESSDEISLGDLPAPSASDSKAGLASGINIGKPKDRGLSLEKGDARSSKKLPPVKLPVQGDAGKSSKKLPAPKPESDEEIDFELSLDQPGASSKKIASSKKLDSDSEFDLTLDDVSDPVSMDAETGSLHAVDDEPKNDIFETDFEIPALDDDSASEAVAIEEADTDLESSSDFDLAIDEPSDVVEEESGSQVVVLDDEIDDEPKARKSGKNKKKKKQAAVEIEDDAEAGVSFDDMDLDESMSASRALKGLRPEDAEVEEVPERVVVEGTAPWGVLPAIFMLPTVFIVFVAGLMAYEMMHSMWGYHQPTAPSSLVIDQVADMLDMKPKDDTATK